MFVHLPWDPIRFYGPHIIFLRIYYWNWYHGSSLIIWNYLSPSDHLQVARVNWQSYQGFADNVDFLTADSDSEADGGDGEHVQ